MLAHEHCEVCQAGAVKLSEVELGTFLKTLPHWEQLDQQGVCKLRRSFTFKSYAQGLAFTNTLAALAEEENHHPDILLQWGCVTVTWWTHTINGLHKNDVIMAAKTDQLY